MRALPEVAAVRPRRTLTVVVLPAPFGPSRPKSSPGRTEMSIPSSAVMRRRSVERYSFRSPLTSITASFMIKPCTATEGVRFTPREDNGRLGARLPRCGDCLPGLRGYDRRYFSMLDSAVFFDPTRRRWWWIKRIGTLVGLAVVVAVSLTLISLEGKILLPIEGITAPLRRQIRRSIHGPRHSTAKLVFLAKKDRQRLLDN